MAKRQVLPPHPKSMLSASRPLSEGNLIFCYRGVRCEASEFYLKLIVVLKNYKFLFIYK